MKNNLSKMREGGLTKHLREKAFKWKDLQKKNAIALTEIYEREQQGLKKLEARYEVVAVQYESVSSVSYSQMDIFSMLFFMKQVVKASKGFTEGLKNSVGEVKRIETNSVEYKQSLKEYRVQFKSKSDEVKKFEKSITQESVNKLYKLLQKKQPPFLSKMAECMVALLRSQSYASPSDVEMYLKNYQSLNYKMSKIDPASVSKEAVEANANRLELLADQFTDSDVEGFQSNSEYIHMFAWCQHFCKLCEIGRIVKDLETRLIEGEERVIFLAEYRSRARDCLEDLDIFDVEQLEEEYKLLKSYVDKTKSQQAQRSAEIKMLQNNYVNFDENFFS